MKRFLSLSAAGALLFSSFALTPEVASAAKQIEPMTDVPAHQQKAVKFLLDRGAPKWAKGQFGVHEKVTREDASALIASALNLDLRNNPPHDFVDVEAKYNKYVRALKASGYMKGITEWRFGSKQYLTRGEVALIVARVYNLKGDPNKVTFTDVSPRYKEAVAALQQHGITNGVTATRYGTHDVITRGNFAQFLYRLSQLNPKHPPQLTGVTLKSESELHLHFSNLIERVSERDIVIEGYRTTESRSAYTETRLTSTRSLKTSVQGSTLIVKTEGQAIFKTGFDRGFDIRIEENAFPSLGTEMFNQEIRIENIDDVIYEDVSKTRLQVKDEASPVLLHARGEYEDDTIDITFTEPVQLVGNERTIAESFHVWNSSNNGRGTTLERIDNRDDMLTVTFGGILAENLLDMNKIRLNYRPQRAGYIQDASGNQLSEQPLIGIQEVRKR